MFSIFSKPSSGDSFVEVASTADSNAEAAQQNAGTTPPDAMRGTIRANTYNQMFRRRKSKDQSPRSEAFTKVLMMRTTIGNSRPSTPRI